MRWTISPASLRIDRDVLVCNAAPNAVSTSNQNRIRHSNLRAVTPGSAHAAANVVAG